MNKEELKKQKYKSWYRDYVLSGRKALAERNYYSNNIERFRNKYIKNRENKEKVKMDRARSYVLVAVNNGTTKKGLCEICLSDRNVIAHHHNYNEPLNIIWLCKVCHSLLHKKLKLLNQTDG